MLWHANTRKKQLLKTLLFWQRIFAEAYMAVSENGVYTQQLAILMRTLSETGWFTSGFFVVTYFQTNPLRLLFVSTSWSFEGGHRRLVLAGGWPAPGASAGGAKGVEYHRISWDISRCLKMSQDTSKSIPLKCRNSSVCIQRLWSGYVECQGLPHHFFHPSAPHYSWLQRLTMRLSGIAIYTWDFNGFHRYRMDQDGTGIQFFCSLVEIAPFCSFAFGSFYLVLPATCRRLSWSQGNCTGHRDWAEAWLCPASAGLRPLILPPRRYWLCSFWHVEDPGNE